VLLSSGRQHLLQVMIQMVQLRKRSIVLRALCHVRDRKRVCLISTIVTSLLLGVHAGVQADWPQACVL